MSKGTDLPKVTIDTTRELAVIGDEVKIGEKCFIALSSHLYNADGVFLPLSLHKAHIRYFGRGTEARDELRTGPFQKIAKQALQTTAYRV